MSQPVNRRQFVKSAACATAALAPAIRASGGQPAGNRVRVGLIGCGGRGRQLLQVLREYPDVDVAAISDVIEPRMQEAAKLLAEGPRPQKPEQVVIHQRILDRRDVDAVVIATTQHWHGLPFIQAAQAGKHVYVEKPLSLTVAEGRAMVEAANKTGVIAMMGTQQRNYVHYPKALEILRSGRLGKIALVECWNYHNTRNRVGRAADSEPPPGYHWDRWLGPAPKVPFNTSRLNNSWWFDYAGGMMTNWAIHHIDIILWAMGASVPTSVACPGGKFVVDDLADTPDTMEASWQFPDFVMQYCYRGFNNFHVVQSRPQHHGICFHGNKATMVLDRSGFEIWEDSDPNKSVEKADNPRYWGDGKPGNEVDGPWQRLFVDCVKQQKKPPLSLEESHRATVCCHLANIAYRVGRQIRWDGPTETIPGDRKAAQLLARPRRKPYELPEV
ncbi:MAG: Gfo/Idh/MocA family oxidoreductase [Pirellulales bacterium]|nr:Gfo/Idh/MocA family oxidoreductase [Pirellulales bacterium]